MTVDTIERPAVRDVPAEIWLEKLETAPRVRQRIGTVPDWAYAKRFRSTEAPMRSLSKGRPSQPRKGDRHNAALLHTEVPALLAKLRGRIGEHCEKPFVATAAPWPIHHPGQAVEARKERKARSLWRRPDDAGWSRSLAGALALFPSPRRPPNALR